MSHNKITLIQTYYNDIKHLERCIERWNCFSRDVEIILIDDGSKTNPAINLLKEKTIRSNIDFSLYAVNDDIGFNSHGCRNLGAKVAKGDWLLFLDIDYTMQPGDLYYLLEEELLCDWYTFNAKPDWDRNVQYHALNQFFIRKDFYAKSGGYDESYVPFHAGDREFLSRLEDESTPGTFENIKLTCWRGGRKAIIDETVPAPIYDDEKMVFYTATFDESKIKRIDTKINFEWTQLL